MAGQRYAPAAEPVPAQGWYEGEEIGPRRDVVAVLLHDLLASAIRSGPEGVVQWRPGEMPAAAVHGATHVHNVGVLGIVAMPLEVDDRRCLARAS